MKINFKSIVDSLTVPTFVIDINHVVVAWNKACEILTGIKSEDIVGTKDAWRGFYKTKRPSLGDVIIDDAFSHLSTLYPTHGESKFSKGAHAENWFPNINGKKRYLIFDAAPIYDDDGDLAGAIESLEDVTEIKLTEERLMLSDEAFSHTNQAIFICNTQKNIIKINNAFSTLSGYEKEEVIGHAPKLLSSDKNPQALYKKIWNALSSTGSWEGEVWDKRKNGEAYPTWLSINRVFNETAQHNKKTHYVALFTDLTERKKTEAHVQHIAFHDALTGLPNRVLLADRLQNAIHEASRNKTKIGLLFIDLDRFKIVNDTLGHSVGDVLLQEVAKRISSTVREADTVARIGGDEFVVVLPKVSNTDDVRLASTRILKKLSQNIEVDEHQLYTTPSIGIAIYPDDGETVDTLMRNADTAMYSVKEGGKNNFQYFTQSMNVATQNRADIEKELRIAIENEQLELHFQPKISTNPFQVVGCEALVRWQHPERGFIMPNDFIPIAEESGLIKELGAWVAKEAVSQLAAWESQGFTDIKMAINVSPVQFRDKTLIRQLRKSLKESALTPNLIEIEVTESVLMKSVPAYNEGLLALKKLGVSLAIDDFGTGYSNLSYLKEFKVDTLKIDKSFVDNINNNQDDAAIVNAVISLAQSLGLEVIAEGVETIEQLEILSARACDAYQGYYFSKPLPADQFLNYIRENNQNKVKRMA